MIVWVLEHDGNGARWVFASKDSALDFALNDETQFATSVKWSLDEDFGDLYHHDPAYEPNVELDRVGSIEGIEVRP